MSERAPRFDQEAMLSPEAKRDMMHVLVSIMEVVNHRDLSNISNEEYEIISRALDSIYDSYGEENVWNVFLTKGNEELASLCNPSMPPKGSENHLQRIASMEVDLQEKGMRREYAGIISTFGMDTPGYEDILGEEVVGWKK